MEGFGEVVVILGVSFLCQAEQIPYRKKKMYSKGKKKSDTNVLMNPSDSLILCI